MSMPTGPGDPFATSDALVSHLQKGAAEADIEDPLLTGTVLNVMTRLSAEPNSVFPSPPSYRREYQEESVLGPAPQLSSTHAFFDVIGARASRRDFGPTAMPAAALISVLGWTFGRRDETISYDWRDAPLRYVPSAGGLASNDAYAIVTNVDGIDNGSYYYDYERGLIPRCRAEMGQSVASMIPGTSWVSQAGALVVVVADAERVDHKYQSMGAKLALLDAGVALGHAELVATALELRCCVLGALPADRLADLLQLEESQVPIATLVVGSRQ